MAILTSTKRILLLLGISASLALGGCGGDDDEGDEPEPVEAEPVLPPMPDAPALATGVDHTCAVKESGEAFCWGRNLDGELGDGTGQNRRTPVPVAGLEGVHQVAPGNRFTCALKRDGTAWCWGRNEYGQLGNGTTTSTPRAVQVSGVSDATAIATGSDFACALLRAGTVMCWGRGASGRLGNGASEDSSSPVAVSGIEGVTAIDLGGEHACALLEAGTLSCWGSDSQGQAGVEGDQSSHNQPAAVAGLTGVTSFSAGGQNTCAIAAGGLHCWGDNYAGKIGNGQAGSDAGDEMTPVAIAVEGIAEVSVGGYQVCARLESGAAKCWGDDGYGNLGAAERGDMNAPTDVAQMSDAQSIAAGGAHVCVVRATGAISCWGKSGEGQLGQMDVDDAYHAGDRIPSLAELSAEAPTVHTFEPAEAATTATPAVALGSGFACAIRHDAHVVCWGTNNSGQLGQTSTVAAANEVREVPGITDATQVTASGSAACVRRATGAIACWGALGYYESSEEYVRTSSPVPMPNVSDATAVALDSSRPCVLHATGNVSCISRGELQPIAGLTGVAQLEGGSGSMCARLEDGGVRCWGSGSYGQLGNGEMTSSNTTPVAVSGIEDAVQIAFGAYHACARLESGGVSCWGTNRYGQIGNGRSGEDQKEGSPVPVRGPRGVVDIAAGTYNSLARLEDGSVLCWGADDHHQCGLGPRDESEPDEITRPTAVAPGTATEMGPAASMSCGLNTCCVLYESGQLACWGSGSVLGTGTLGGLISSRADAPRPLTQVSLGSAPAPAAPTEAAPAAEEPAAEEPAAEEPAAEEPAAEEPAAEEPAPTEDPAAAEAPSARRPARSHRSLVEAAVRQAAQGCYQRLGSHGPVTVRVVVGPDGRVTTSQVVNNGTGNQEVGRCISGAMVSRRFTAPRQGAVTFDIPFSG